MGSCFSRSRFHLSSPRALQQARVPIYRHFGRRAYHERAHAGSPNQKENFMRTLKLMAAMTAALLMAACANQKEPAEKAVAHVEASLVEL
jgi:hypothetical protein